MLIPLAQAHAQYDATLGELVRALRKAQLTRHVIEDAVLLDTDELDIAFRRRLPLPAAAPPKRKQSPITVGDLPTPDELDRAVERATASPWRRRFRGRPRI